MKLLVVGTIAFDSVETPTASRTNVIGGSATFFSYAASYFTPVNLVGVVGEDWPQENTEMFQSRNIDTAGLEVVAGEKTFSWSGKYLPNMNDRETLELNLNVFGSFNPDLPESYKTDVALFLDTGNVWGVDYSDGVDDSSKIRSSIGIAANVFTPIGPLSWTLSQALTKANTDVTETFNFNIGTSF